MDFTYQLKRPTPTQWFVLVQFVWTVILLSIYSEIGPPSAFLIWFIGFHISVELLPLARISSRSRLLLRGLVYVGYVCAAVIIYLFFFPL